MRVTYFVHPRYDGKSRFLQADYLIDPEDDSEPQKIYRSTKRENKKAAEAVAQDQARKFEEQGIGGHVHRDITFQAFAAGRVEALDVKPSVKRDYQGRMDNHILTFFGKMKVAAITYDTIEKFDIAMKAGRSGRELPDGKRKGFTPLSRASRKHVFTVLDIILDRATKPPVKILSVNPTVNYKILRDDKKVDIRKPRKKVKKIPLTEAQLAPRTRPGSSRSRASAATSTATSHSRRSRRGGSRHST